MNPIGETKHNAETKWKEHCSNICSNNALCSMLICSNNDHKSEATEHLLKNRDHSIGWQAITSAPHQRNKWKILEAFYITKFKPSLNNQLDVKVTQLFRNGIT